MAFRGCRSTHHGEEIIGYTELVAGLVRLSTELNHELLRNSPKRFRDPMIDLHDRPVKGFEKLVNTLGTSSMARQFWAFHLSNLYADSYAGGTTNSDHIMEPQYIDSQCDPFHHSRKHVSTSLTKEEACVPAFIEQYELAGGF